MKKIIVCLVLLLSVFAPVTPSHAFTEIARCEGQNPMGCSAIFVSPLNIEGAHVRLIPGILMIGTQETQIFEVGNISNEVHYIGTWITGRIQISGPTYSGPYQLLAGHTYVVITVPRDIATPVNVTAVVEV